MNEQIEQAAKQCRAAWAANPEATIAWCFHHGVRLEPLPEPAEKRIAFILSNKNQEERVVRLLNFRPFAGELPVKMQKADADMQKAYAEWQKADAEWQKAYADIQKADADIQKADAEWQKAYADIQKAYADMQKAYADCADEIAILHLQQVPNHTWNGKDIF